MKHFFLIANGVLSLFILSFVMVFAAQYYQVGNTATVTVNEWSACNTVTDNCGPTIFVPTNTSAEWSTFRTNKPACATLGSCVSSGDCPAASITCDCTPTGGAVWGYSYGITANGSTAYSWSSDDYTYCSNGQYYEYYMGQDFLCY